MQPNPPSDLPDQVAAALREDIGSGDLTADLIPANIRASATVVSNETAIFCGRPWFDETFRQLDPQVRVEWAVEEGQRITPKQLLCKVEGPVRALLTGERTALNFLQTLSGTATGTRPFVDAVAGTRCEILDTRKTLPGLRTAQKYATRWGGARNHRIGLYDAVLVKENHITAAGSIAGAIEQARRHAQSQTNNASVRIEVEVEDLDQFREALKCGPDWILLDDFTPIGMQKAVQANIAAGGKIKLEASGNVTLENIRLIARTGVDFISVGALTKHVRAIDLSMRIGT